MRLPLIASIVVAILSFASDYCIYRGLKRLRRGKRMARIHALIAAALYAEMIAAIAIVATPSGERAFVYVMWGIFTFLSVYIGKYIYAAFWALSRVPLLWKRKPWKPVAYAGIALGAFCFLSMWWGSLVTTRQIEVNEVELAYDNLPPAFDGYRIVQFSDLHTGTYGESTSIVANIAERVNALKPDLAVFTGDIVNRKTDEILPFIPVLKKVEATDGVVTILGNHDYGDYYRWPDPEAKADNLNRLVAIERDSLGWRMLRNEHFFLKKGNDSIAVIGVENWGEPPFSTYGDLNASYPDLNDSHFKLLLSHNPKHWDMVVSRSSNIDLTLSGHTHAMQLMISAGGRIFSPAAWKYKHWQGLATADNGGHLYVNIGTGEVGVPMRIGATPELTVITLRRKRK